MSPRSPMLQSKLEQKVKYLSGFSMEMHHSFRTGLVFSELVKLSPISCMLQLKLMIKTEQKVKYLSGFSMEMHQIYQNRFRFF